MGKQDRLLFIDMLVLWIIAEQAWGNIDLKEVPSQRQLLDLETKGGLVNDFIDDHDIDPIYTVRFTGFNQLNLSIRKLRRLGFIEPSGRYHPTPSGLAFIKKSGPDWRKWPVSVPILRNGTLDFTDAVYIPFTLLN